MPKLIFLFFYIFGKNLTKISLEEKDFIRSNNKYKIKRPFNLESQLRILAFHSCIKGAI